jgi:SecD/SecF fusion protein
MRDPAGERLSASERVTRSVDRILSRAFLTSLSTLVPALTILFVGLGPLEDFARVMILGTVAGTLSSMFVVGSFAVRALEREDRVDGWTAAEKRPVYT